jgi:hypothetical protein
MYVHFTPTTFMKVVFVPKKRVGLPACGAESNGNAGKAAGPGLQPPRQHLGAAVQVVVTFNKDKA